MYMHGCNESMCMYGNSNCIILYVRMYVCTYVRTYVCMYACMYYVWKGGCITNDTRIFGVTGRIL